MMIFLIMISALVLLPAIVIPRQEWDVELWLVSGGAIWLLFMMGPVAELVRYLWAR